MNTSDIIAGIAAIASLWALRRTEETRGVVLRAAWDQSRWHRKQFWKVIRATYLSYCIGKSDEWSNDLSALAVAAGMPPNVPVRKGAQVKDWYDDNQKILNADQRRIWEFVASIYPPRTEGTIDVMDQSSVRAPDREVFDEARRALATFFHRQQEALSSHQLFKAAGHAYADVLLLSWLELALVRGTQDERPGTEGYQGKRGLYEFGNYLACQHKR